MPVIYLLCVYVGTQKAPVRSHQFPLPWALIAAVPHVSLAAFRSSLVHPHVFFMVSIFFPSVFLGFFLKTCQSHFHYLIISISYRLT